VSPQLPEVLDRVLWVLHRCHRCFSVCLAALLRALMDFAIYRRLLVDWNFDSLTVVPGCFFAYAAVTNLPVFAFL
jgi:hypothetical protein